MHPELFTIPGINFTVPSYGAMTLIGFLFATFWMTRIAQKVKTDPDIVLNLGFIILIFSMLGARTFYVIHYWDDQFADNPLQAINIRAGGFEFYGGLIGAFLACAVYLKLKRLSLRLYCDMVTAPLLFAMGVGRIGCFLYGCCWGGPCPAETPWAVHFPYASPPHHRQWKQRIATLPDELTLINRTLMASPIPQQFLTMSRDEVQQKLNEATSELEQAEASGDPRKIKLAKLKHLAADLTYQPFLDHLDAFDTTPSELKALADQPQFKSSTIHPVQLYAATGPILLSLLAISYFHRRKRHGTVMALGFGLYAIERFIEEIIRVDNPQDTFGLTVSQGISVAILVLAIFVYLILQKMPLRSPRAVAFVPAENDT